MGISIVGIAFGLTNLYSIYTDAPSKIACQVEHVKAAVGAGISVYAAFMACGLARLNPGRALNQKMWAIPLLIGLTLIIICIRPGSGSRGGARRPSSAPCPTQSRPAIAAPSTMADASSDGARSSRAGAIAVAATPAPPAGSPLTASRRRIRGNGGAASAVTSRHFTDQRSGVGRAHSRSCVSITRTIFSVPLEGQTSHDGFEDSLKFERQVGSIDVKRLLYARNSFREMFRLYPPITFLPRIAAQDTDIARRRVKRRTMLMIAP